MKIAKYTRVGLAVAVALLTYGGAIQKVSAQFYTADAATYGNLSVSNDYAAKLFFGTSASPGTPVPDGTVVWFVASVDNTFQTAGSGGSVSGFLTPDDTLLFSIQVNGVQSGSGPLGSLVRDSDNNLAIQNIAEANSPKNIHVYLWNQFAATPAAAAAFVPQDGMHYGVFSLGVRPDPNTPGQNANWIWNQSIFADTFVVGVPEPSTFALGGLGLVGLIGYRRFKK